MVAVKRFPENTYFSEMLFSGKGKYFHVFGCISKNFLENIFWCLEKNKENINPEKHKPQLRKKSSTTTTARSRSEIAISDLPLSPSIAISIRRALATTRQRSTAQSRRPTLLLSRARALSLSLSFFENALKGKYKCKLISVVKGIFLGSTDFNFRKIEFSEPTKQPHFRKSISGSDFHPKQTQPKSEER